MNLQWDGHMLQVNANDVSLNALLHGIARRTGMRLVGSIPDDHIFGTYGPAPLIEVVSQLLDGMRVNVLFVHHSGSKPPELTLTARAGGPSAPAPQQPAAQNLDTGTPMGANPGSFRGLRGPALGGTGQPQEPAEGVQQAQPDAPDPSAPGDAAATANPSGNPASPNGVKTPEEIFEQLQRLRATTPQNR